VLLKTRAYVLCISSVITSILTKEKVNIIGQNQQPLSEYFVENNLVFWHVLSASENTTVQPKTLQLGGTVGGFIRSLIESLGGWDAKILAEDTDLTNDGDVLRSSP
jgi:hypothetical protein